MHPYRTHSTHGMYPHWMAPRECRLILTLRAQGAPLPAIAKALKVNWDKAAKMIAIAEHWPGQQRKHRPGSVYFIKMVLPHEDCAIKVGWSSFPEQRLEDLQTGSPFPLCLLASYPALFTEEAVVLKRLADAKMRGEWHRPTPTVLAEIAKHTHRGVVNGR